MDDSLCKPDIQKLKSHIQGYCLHVQITVWSIPWMLVCFLFVWDFSSHLRFFNSYGDVTITGEG